MKRIAFSLACALCACSQPPATSAARVELRRVSGSVVELVPAREQHPYCLVFTVSEKGGADGKGTIRQLTMPVDNQSVKCEPGSPIGGVSFRIPVDEGKVRAYVFLSSQKLNAGSIAQQLLEASRNAKVSALDLRLPGQVNLEVLEFAPEPDRAPAVGAVVSPQAPDAGASVTAAGAP